MFRTYFKVGLRNLLRHKLHSLINIAGLAAGITCCLFIVLYITDELSYDRYHAKAGRIYRITMADWAKMPPAFAPEVLATYPHLAESAVRLWPLFSPAKVRREGVVFVESGGVFADAGVFSVFSWQMVSGNPLTALGTSNSIVFTETMAKKYFGSEDAMGKQVQFWGRDLTVTGIMRDVPANSHLQFDFLVSFPTLYSIFGKDLDENWKLPVFYTYVVSREGVPVKDLEHAATRLVTSRDAYKTSPPLVQPVESIHLHSDMEGEFAPGGSITYLYTLGTAAIIVLLLACINFTNLTTVRAATRTKEVGIRKVMGAMRRQLVGQFFGEALILSFVAFLIAVTVVNLTLPGFNYLAGKAIQFERLADPVMMVALLGIMVLIGLTAGAYPALYLSMFKPASVLKGWSTLPASNVFVRKGLIVFQFAMSTVFLIGMTVVILQLHYLQSKDLGFDQEHVLVLDGDNFPQIADALQSVAGVEHVAGVPQIFGGPLPMSRYKAEGLFTDSLSQMRHYGVTSGFIQTMGMKLIAGQNFKEGSDTVMQGNFILNESALRALGWEDANDAIGRSFSMLVPPMNGGEEVWRVGKIVGIVKDFNYEPLYRDIEPVVLYPSYDLNLTLVRVSGVNTGLLQSVKAVWDKVNPQAPFNYYFLDEHLQRQYESEQKLENFLRGATALAVMIACLGLYALVAFSAAQRTKEVGIRKVLGATVSQIVSLLSADFLKTVSLGVVLGLPIAYVVMKQWLDTFAYHVSLSWWIFAGVGLMAILLAAVTVGCQSFKSAQADPAESIRYE